MQLSALMWQVLGYQLGTSPCVIPICVRCYQTGQAEKNECETAGAPFLPASDSLLTRGCWSCSQGTFGPLHIKHPGKSNSSCQREQFQKEEKEEQEL